MYRIKDWNDHFERADTRRCKRMLWVSLSNKHEGKGYRTLIRMSSGVTHYAAWVLMVQLASKCPVRGTLADADGPMTAADMALRTDAPEIIFAEAFEPLLRIGWLEVVEVEDDAKGLPARYQRATSTPRGHPDYRTGQDKTGQDRDKSAPPTTPALADEVKNAWNDLGAPFPKAVEMTGKRLQQLRERLKSQTWQENWRRALEKIKASSFCQGKNDRHWIANFDFFLRPNTVTKAIEGNYDDAPSERNLVFDSDWQGVKRTPEELARIMATSEEPRDDAE